MPLLEKAYAKLHQNYDRIIGGNGDEALRALTGMPTVNLRQDLSKKATMLPNHKYFASKNFPMTTGCCRQVSGGIDGLISGHAYSLLDIAELKNTAGQVVHTLAKVRNPWASEHYTGKWRDDDPGWTTDFS